MKPHICHPCNTRSMTKAAPLSTKSLKTKTQSELRGHLGLGQWVGNLVGTVKDATVAIQQKSSAKRWSPENLLPSYLAGDDQSSFKAVLPMTSEIKPRTSWHVHCRVGHSHGMLSLSIQWWMLWGICWIASVIGLRSQDGYQHRIAGTGTFVCGNWIWIGLTEV